MSRIYDCPLLGYIDLDKIIRVTKAMFIDCMGSGGLFVEFTIDVQLRDEPIQYRRELTGEEFIHDLDGGYFLAIADGTRAPYCEYEEEPDNLLCVANLQREIDDLICVWAST